MTTDPARSHKTETVMPLIIVNVRVGVLLVGPVDTHSYVLVEMMPLSFPRNCIVAFARRQLVPTREE